MRKNTTKAAAMAVLAGTLFQLGGCNLMGLLQAAAIEVVAEQVAGFLPIGDLLGGITGGNGTTTTP
jgi:hypothetical protein